MTKQYINTDGIRANILNMPMLSKKWAWVLAWETTGDIEEIKNTLHKFPKICQSYLQLVF